jgi:hypothetical protein
MPESRAVQHNLAEHARVMVRLPLLVGHVLNRCLLANGAAAISLAEPRPEAMEKNGGLKCLLKVEKNSSYFLRIWGYRDSRAARLTAT